jgi:hypothetical protein
MPALYLIVTLALGLAGCSGPTPSVAEQIEKDCGDAAALWSKDPTHKGESEAEVRRLCVETRTLKFIRGEK